MNITQITEQTSTTTGSYERGVRVRAIGQCRKFNPEQEGLILGTGIDTFVIAVWPTENSPNDLDLGVVSRCPTTGREYIRPLPDQYFSYISLIVQTLEANQTTMH